MKLLLIKFIKKKKKKLSEIYSESFLKIYCFESRYSIH